MTMEFDVNNSIISKCRVCFEEKDNLHSIFKRWRGASAYDKLVSCTKLSIEKHDGGPSLICNDCLKELETTVRFLEKCEKSNALLSSLNLTITRKDVTPQWDCLDAAVAETCGGAAVTVCEVCGVHDGCQHSKYQCHLCGKHFKRKDNLKVHRERHSGEPRYSCAYCGAWRYTRGELSTHMKTHAPKQHAHKCYICEKTFTAKANLHIHMRKHTGERPHECDVCHKKFISQTTLRVHHRIHTGVKPYMCSVCGASFASNKLSRHMRLHTNAARARTAPRLRLLCPRAGCNNRYAHKQSLNKHIRNHHKEKPNSGDHVTT